MTGELLHFDANKTRRHNKKGLMEGIVLEFPTEEASVFETCVSCKELTEVKKSMPVELRSNYVEGIGQLHPECYADTYTAENMAEAEKYALEIAEKLYGR